MAYCVYILENPNGRFYIGQTDNLNRRVEEHNSPTHNTHKYTTKHSGPWNLVYSETYATRQESIARERLEQEQHETELDGYDVENSEPTLSKPLIPEQLAQAISDRVRHRLSGAELCRLSGVGHPSLSQFIHGRRTYPEIPSTDYAVFMD